MSRLSEPCEVKLFMGLIYKPDSSIEDLFPKLEDELGKIDYLSCESAFDHSTYYLKEMGADLKRRLITFTNLINRSDIVRIKTFTNNLEEVFSYEGQRTINIDPGYIAQEHVILATGKGFSHRPYLGGGVYADLTLVYKRNEYRILEWTYPDYGSEDMRSLFKELRQKYVKQLEKESEI